MPVICGGNKPFSAFRARLEAFNGSKWGFLKIVDFWRKSENPENRYFGTFRFRRENLERSSWDTDHRLMDIIVRKQNLVSGKRPKLPVWHVPKSRFWPLWTSTFKMLFCPIFASNAFLVSKTEFARPKSVFKRLIRPSWPWNTIFSDQPKWAIFKSLTHTYVQGPSQPILAEKRLFEGVGESRNF